MAKRPVEDMRLARLTEIALAFPEATRKIPGSHAQFLIRKKTFACFLDNHHGDVMPGDNKRLAKAQPRRFYLPAYLAERLGCIAVGPGQDRLGRSEGTAVGELLDDRSKATGGTAYSDLTPGQ